MAHTDTTVSNLKINRGTYANIQANLASIGENELIITTDKSIPVPSSSDSGKVVSVNSLGDFTLTTPSSGTTYTFADGTNSFTVTPAGGTPQTVNVTPTVYSLNLNSATYTGTWPTIELRGVNVSHFNNNKTLTDLYTDLKANKAVIIDIQVQDYGEIEVTHYYFTYSGGDYSVSWDTGIFNFICNCSTFGGRRLTGVLYWDEGSLEPSSYFKVLGYKNFLNTTETTTTINSIAQFSNTRGEVVSGPTFGSATTTFLRNDGTWTAPNKQSKTLYAFPVAEVSGSYTIVSTANATRWYFTDDVSGFPSSVTWLGAEAIYNFMPTYDLYILEIQLDSELSVTDADGYLNIIEANNEMPNSLYDFYTKALGEPAYLVFENKNLSKQLTLNFRGAAWYIPAYATISTTPVNNHSHGNITNDGKIGTTANYVVTTTTGGAVTASSTVPSAVVNATLGAMPTWTADPTDSTYLIRQDTGGTASFGRVTFSTVWNYVKGKTTISNASTTKAYVTGIDPATANKHIRYYDADTTTGGVYLSTNPGEIVAAKFNVSGNAYMSYDSTEEAIKFTFA